MLYKQDTLIKILIGLGAERGDLVGDFKVFQIKDKEELKGYIKDFEEEHKTLSGNELALRFSINFTTNGNIFYLIFTDEQIYLADKNSSKPLSIKIDKTLEMEMWYRGCLRELKKEEEDNV